VEGPSVQLHRAFSTRPHFHGVEVSVHPHTAAEVPLVDITAVEVLLADFMEVGVDFMEAEVDFVEVEGDSMEAEVEVREVTAKPHSLFPINYPDHQSRLFGFGRFGRVSLEI